MASWLDVRRIALALPETTEGGRLGYPSWSVHKKVFASESPLRRTDTRNLDDLGQDVPEGAILSLAIDHADSREDMIAEQPDLLFTVPQLAGYPTVLVRLDRVTEADLETLLEDAWLVRAPEKLAAARVVERESQR